MPIVQQELLKKIKEFGLNSYEAKIWTALLSRGVSTAGELSDIANVPRSRSYDVLESLEKKGFIVMKIGKPIKYIAVDPDEVIERVKKGIKAGADKQAEQLEKLRESDIIQELKHLHKNGVDMVDPTELTGSMKSRSNSYDQIDTMMKAAEKSITMVTTADGIRRKGDVHFRSLKKAHERGVKIKIACPATAENASVLKDLSQIAEIRDLRDVSARFVIADGNEILFMLMHDSDVHPAYDVGVWINAPFFASALEQLFELAWKQAKELKVKA